MKIIDRYIFTNFIAIFLFCLILLYILFVIGDIFGFLDEILREGISAKSLALFYLHLMPFVITQIAPVSCLLASVFLLGNLNKYNEITALKASGISLFKILRPMLIGASVIGAVLFLLNDKVVPHSMRIANKIRYEKLEVGKHGSSNKIKDVAIYGKGNKIIFTRVFDIQNNVLEDTIIHTHDNARKVISKVSARKLVWENNEWIGEDVVVCYINENGEFLYKPEVFKKRKMDLKETPLDFINNQWQPQYMSYMQLKKYLAVFLADSKLAKKRFTVDLHYKLAFPFACIVIILMAAPFTVVTTRGGALLGMAMGILVTLPSYVLLVAIGLALGKGGSIHPILAAWLANIVLGGIGLYRSLRH